MTLQKNNVTEAVVLFNCTSGGRMESVNEGTWNLDSYRSKEIITWTDAKFEFYSWQAQAELENGDSTFEDGVKNEETLSYGAIYKKGGKSVEGRIIDYRWDRDAMDPYRIRSVRFSRDLVADSPFAFSYYFLSDSRLDNFFTSSYPADGDQLDRAYSYHTFKEDKFDSPQFCMARYEFPFTFKETECPNTFSLVTDSLLPDITLVDYQMVNPADFKLMIAGMGEIEIDWDKKDIQSASLGVGTKRGTGTYLIQGEEVLIFADPGDSTGVDHVKLFFDGNEIKELHQDQIVDGRYQYSINSHQRTNGSHEIKAIFYDGDNTALTETHMYVYILNQTPSPQPLN
jgi:hypothetical protein